jgi:CDP-diacylglycerol--glycerol-3-phosphate 3-phosphatidyltransferase
MLTSIRPALNRLLAPVGRGLARRGVTADQVTVVGTLGVVGGAVGFYPRGSFVIGTLVIAAFVFNDMIDGAVARAGGGSGRWGAFLDSAMDRLGDAAVFGSLAVWFAGGGHSFVMAAVCVYDLGGAEVTSYVKARAEGLGLACNVGIAERAERLLAILIATFFAGVFGVPALQVVALWGLAAAITITIGQRFVRVHREAAALPAGATTGSGAVRP